MTTGTITKEKILTPYQIKMRAKKNRFARRIYDKTSKFLSNLIVKITFFYLFIFICLIILVVLISSLFNNFSNFDYMDAFLIKATLNDFVNYNNVINFDVYLGQIFLKFLILIKYGIIIHFIYSGKSTILDYIPKRSLSRFLIRKLSWFCALLFILKFMVLNSFYLEYFLLYWLKNIIYIKYH
jgi:hypothetical protein